MTKRLELPKFQAFDSNGDPLSGGLVYTYSAGTVTLKTTYSDYDAVTPNANPVVLDSRGEADIYVQGSYKIVLKDSAGTTIWTLDNVQGGVGADAGGEDYYYPDSTATDQGATGNSDTIKYAVDTIGSDNGTIYLKHDSGAATTTYTLTTSETIPSNITLLREPGAIIDGAGTLTMNGVIRDIRTKLFGSSITVTGSPIIEATTPELFGAVGDGVTEDYDAVNAALTHWYQRTIIGEFRFLSGKNYLISTSITLTLTRNVQGPWAIRGYGSKITAGITSGTLLTLGPPSSGSQHLSIEGLYIYGSGNGDSMILLQGGSDITKSFYGVTVKDVYLQNFEGHGLQMIGNFFESEIANVHARGVATNTTGYCIWAANSGTGTISSLTIRNCVTDYGYYGIYVETPAGDVKLQECTSIRAQYEGMFLESNFGTHVLNCHVEANYQSAGSAVQGQAGLKIIGSGTVSGVQGVGANQANVLNVFVSAGGHMTIIEGQQFDPVTHYAYVGGGALSYLTYIGSYDIWINDDAPNVNISRIGYTYKDFEVALTSGTGEDDLMSYTLPDDNLAKYEGLRITAFGQKANANGNKTLKFYFGSTSFTFHAAANNTNDWRFVAEIINYRDDTDQVISWVGHDGATVTQGLEIAAEDTTGGDIIIKVTGECAHASDVIYQNALIVERF